MTDILFITPNLKNRDATESIGTLLLATILRSNGLSTDVVPFYDFGDPSDFDGFLNTANEKILERKPKIVSFYTRCDYYHIMLKMAQRLKQEADVYVVFGGPHSDICAEDTIREIPWVDFVCCGEGETTVYPFFTSLLKGEPDLTVAGLVYRQDGAVVKNPRPVMLADLDTLPEVDFSAFSLDEPKADESLFLIDVGRGCPFGCTYCSTQNFWGRKYRLKSSQRIVNEIKAAHERYGITRFYFTHDMFTMNRKQVLEICGMLKQLPFAVEWKCSARIDCLDQELIDEMVDAGMFKIFIGIETGSPRMQKCINKNLKLDSVPEFLAYIHSKGVSITASFIYGFPEETEEDLSQTMALIQKIINLKDVMLQTHLCTFLPGTEMSRRYSAELTPASSYSDITGTTGLAECMDLVEAHPVLFPQFQEYKTELRTALRDFKLFFRIWYVLQPVYQYFSEHYDADRLIDMYYDFVNDNREILDATAEEPIGTRIEKVIAQDRFAQRFADSEYADMIQDYYRMFAMNSSRELEETGVAVNLYCFSPLEFGRGTRLQDYKRDRVLAVYTLDKNGTFKISVQKGF